MGPEIQNTDLIQNRPKVSVCLITYNHEPYIRQAIEGALMQETDFDFEVVIGEDQSSDGTRQIVLEYQEKFPDKIRTLMQKREDVIFINGNATGRFNLLSTLQATRGQYVAILDGDDYWTDPQKLQVQADFMDRHEDCTLSFHGLKYIYEGKPATETKSVRFPAGTVMDGRDWLKDHVGKRPCTFMYRREVFDKLPGSFWKVAQGDMVLVMHAMEQGLSYYLDREMAVYRVHPEGIWSKLTQERRVNNMIQFLESLQEEYPGKYDDLIIPMYFEMYIGLARLMRNSGDGDKFFKYLRHAVGCWQLKSRLRYQPVVLLLGYLAWKLPFTDRLRTSMQSRYSGTQNQQGDL